MNTTRPLPLILLLSALSATAACSNDAEFDALTSQAEGIYQLQSHDENSVACEPGGESLLIPGRDGFAVAYKGSIFGTPYLYLWSCASPADCRNKAARFDAGESVNMDFSYALYDIDGDALIGTSANTGYGASGTCTDGRITEATLTVDSVGLSLVQETTVANDYAANSEGYCTTDLTQDAARGNSCSEMTTLTAVFVETL